MPYILVAVGLPAQSGDRTGTREVLLLAEKSLVRNITIWRNWSRSQSTHDTFHVVFICWILRGRYRYLLFGRMCPLQFRTLTTGTGWNDTFHVISNYPVPVIYDRNWVERYLPCTKVYCRWLFPWTIKHWYILNIPEFHGVVTNQGIPSYIDQRHV